MSEKIEPVAWVVTNGGPSCEPWLVWEPSEVKALPPQCIAEPLYSATTVSALEARVKELEYQVGRVSELVPMWRQFASPSDSDVMSAHDCADDIEAAITGAQP